MLRRVVGPDEGTHRGALLRQAPSALLALALLFAAGACDATGGATQSSDVTPSPSSAPTAAPTSIPTATPTRVPIPTKKPFFPALAAVGGSNFVGLTGAPLGSVCSVKAFLKTGQQISGPALKPRTVTNVSAGVSWSDQDGQLLKLPSPAPSPIGKGSWQITCTNTAFDPPSRTTTSDFNIP